jgi:error-prone DNA polymerase
MRRERWDNAPANRTRGQLEHELGIIERLKLAGYFLIVWDIVQFCREHRSWCKGAAPPPTARSARARITAIDAVKMELLFERVLSDERGEWPDIDLDLPSSAWREQVTQYLYHRYGERGATMTANIITYRTRRAVREVAQVLGFTPAQVDRLAQLNRVYKFHDYHDDLPALLKHSGIDPTRRAPACWSN